MKRLFDKEIYDKQILFWLIACSIAIIFMLFLGGLTRLTNSGLSIVKWEPITGIIPPLNNMEWEKEFNLYKNFPQYKQLNYTMKLEEFKFIYILEFIHRLAARITGFLFIIPLCYFLYKKILPKKIKLAVFYTIIIGLIQGFFGWYMVKSGLSKNPEVSHFRLALHLLTAFIIFFIIFWQICNLLLVKNKNSGLKFNNLDKIYYIYIFLCLTIFVQIFFGALIAGLKAGYIYNDFPLMGGYWIPPEIFYGKNLLYNKVFVQFFHRILGIIILIMTIYSNIFLKSNIKMPNIIRASNIFLFFISVQIMSGILTLIYVIPINLALFHQLNSMMLIASLIYIINFLFNIREA